MKSSNFLSLLLLGGSCYLPAQCPDAFFCSQLEDVVIFKDSIPICEDIYDGEKDGFTDYVEFLGCQNKHTWVTRFYKRKEVLNCDFTNSFASYEETAPYQTVFFDDFDGEQVDSAKWNLQDDLHPNSQSLPICKNGEIKLRSPDNHFLKDGLLHFQIKKLEQPLEFTCAFPDGTSSTNRRKYTTCRATTFRDRAWSGNESCFQYGRFTIRSKNPSAKGAEGSFWMFGWGAEIDIFEMCKPKCHEIQTNRYNYLPDPFSVNCDQEKGPFVSFPQDHDVGNIFKFREYSLEWTPHKLTWLVDGKVIRTFHRYWKITRYPDNRVCAEPLECEDLPENHEFEVWEHMGWWPLDHRLDVIIGCGVNESQGKPDYAEYLVDWVKIEQKTNAVLLGPASVCDTTSATFKLENIDPDLVNEWSVSPNLTIRKNEVNEIEVTLNEQTANQEKGWVAVNFRSSHNCYGQTLKKELTVGLPHEPEIFADPNCTYVAMNILNFQEDNAYRWDIERGTTEPLVYQNGRLADFPTELFAGQDIPFTVEVTNSCGETSFSSITSAMLCDEVPALKVTPNPAWDLARIKVENLSLDELKNAPALTIIDRTGQTVFSQKINSFFFELDVTDFVDGLYFILLQNNQEVIASEKLLISRIP